MIDLAKNQSADIRWQQELLTKSIRSDAMGQRPAVLWFTGISGAGKSTVANLIEKRLFDLSKHTYLLDGDNLRHGVNRDLGFTDADRVENIRRVAEIARLFVDAGLIVLVALISPFQAERRFARELLEVGEFIEIFVDTPLEIAEQRDPKGLYKRARSGAIKHFTGLDSPYEIPEYPELTLRTESTSAEELADEVIQYLFRHQYLS